MLNKFIFFIRIFLSLPILENTVYMFGGGKSTGVITPTWSYYTNVRLGFSFQSQTTLKVVPSAAMSDSRH